MFLSTVMTPVVEDLFNTGLGRVFVGWEKLFAEVGEPVVLCAISFKNKPDKSERGLFNTGDAFRVTSVSDALSGTVSRAVLAGIIFENERGCVRGESVTCSPSEDTDIHSLSLSSVVLLLARDVFTIGDTTSASSASRSYSSSEISVDETLERWLDTLVDKPWPKRESCLLTFLSSPFLSGGEGVCAM